MLLKVWNLEEAWRETCRAVMKFGNDYTITRGSYVGQQRRQLPHITLIIEHPETRPLAPICKTGEIPVTSIDTIETYFLDYLMSSSLADKESYTYGNRAGKYLTYVMNMLKDTPDTNQACIQIGQPSDVLLDDPPCLRLLDWKVNDDKLCISVWFRSWDVHGALSTNLGGLQLLNEMVAEYVGAPTGSMVACSSGAHVYDHAWELTE